MIFQLTIPGETPSLKNSKQVIQVKGKPRLIPSKAYQDWAKGLILELKRCELAGQEWNYPIKVDFHFYRSTYRRFDFINLAQGPLDLMVEAGILTDDDMCHVIPGEWGWSVDKGNPRAVLTIHDGGQPDANH